MSRGGVYDALVIGAGPGGAAAALGLARAGARVLVCEAGPLPRHRLCGEFVSPEAGSDLAALGLDLGAVAGCALQAARIEARGSAAEAPLGGLGRGVARRVLDAWLAQAAVRAGAELRTRTVVRGVDGDLAGGFRVGLGGAGPETVRARVVIGAFGKRAGGLRRRRSAQGGAVALKAHLQIDGDVAPRVLLHAFAGGYAGTAPVGAGRLNVCLVARPQVVRGVAGGGAAGALGAIVARLPRLQAVWRTARLDPASTCAESGLRFGAAAPLWNDVLLVGDAAALPHPLSGDGIAMALRGGRLVADHAALFLRRDLGPAALAAGWAQAWRREFGPRLRWGAVLHAMLERPRVVEPVLEVLDAWPAALRFLVERTRGTPVAPSLSLREDRCRSAPSSSVPPS
jgi:flavin-dependent dehydrogenase